MIKKIYSYPGITAGDIKISVGKALVNVRFNDGYLDKKMNRPATYTTGDPVMQAIIENSPLFGTRIFLKDTYVTEEAAETKKSKAAKSAKKPVVEDPVDLSVEEQLPEQAEPTEYPEVTTLDGVVGILKTLPGVKAAQLRSVLSCQKIAKEHGIVFPNYTFE